MYALTVHVHVGAILSYVSVFIAENVVCLMFLLKSELFQDQSDVRTDEDNDSMSTGSAGSLQDPDSMEFESEGEENGVPVDEPEFERRNSVVEVSNTG